jgi:hypothetical protein
VELAPRNNLEQMPSSRSLQQFTARAHNLLMAGSDVATRHGALPSPAAEASDCSSNYKSLEQKVRIFQKFMFARALGKNHFLEIGPFYPPSGTELFGTPPSNLPLWRLFFGENVSSAL